MLLLLDNRKGSIHKERAGEEREEGRKRQEKCKGLNKELKGESLGSMCRG